MKSLNKKTLATLCIGTGLLIGSALAAVPDSAKDKAFYWDGSGNTNVQIVVGANAAISDGIAAANLAAMIGSKAYADAKEVVPVAKGQIKIKVSGTPLMPSIPKESVYIDASTTGAISDESIGSTLTLGSSHGLKSGTITYNSNSYDYREKVEIDNTVKLGYGEGSDYHGIYFQNTGNRAIRYEFDFVKSFPVTGGKLNQSVEIPFMGEDYLINKASTTEVELIKGTKIYIGSGEEKTVKIGETEYIVKLTGVGISEVTNIGYATVQVSGGTLTFPIQMQLDTSGTESETADGVTVYLQSVSRAYTPGVGGAATLRVGGEALKLVNGERFPGSDTWKTKIVAVNDKIDSIQVYLDKTYSLTDKVSKITAPRDYFTLEYNGREIDRGEIDSDTLSIEGMESSNYLVIDKLSYSDLTYGNKYSLSLWDDTEHRNKVFLGDANGAITNTTGSMQFLPLHVGDAFIVNQQPMNINSVHYDINTPANSYVKINGEQYPIDGLSVTTPAAYAGYDTITAVGLKTKGISVNTNKGTKQVSIAIASDNAMSNYTEYGDVIYITTGVDADYIESDYYKVGIESPTWDTANEIYNTMNATQAYVGFKAASAPNSLVSFNKTSSESGLVESNGFVNQLSNHAGDDQYKYQQTAYADFEATSSNKMNIKVFKDNSKLRTMLYPKTTSVTEATTTDGEVITSTVVSSDTMPKEVSSGVSVIEFNITADPIKTNAVFGTVKRNLVISDSTVSQGNTIVIGGHFVNKMAANITEDKLIADGDKYTGMAGTTLYVGGYTASDTTSAVEELLAAINLL